MMNPFCPIAAWYVYVWVVQMHYHDLALAFMSGTTNPAFKDPSEAY